MLKDLVFSGWAADGCEERADTLKMVSLVDFFLPFLPLERRHIEILFQMRLQETAAQLQRAQSVRLEWAPEIISFLTDKVCLPSVCTRPGFCFLCMCAMPLCHVACDS